MKKQLKKEDWKKAMAVEMQSVKKNGTWDMVDLPNEKFYGDLHGTCSPLWWPIY